MAELKAFSRFFAFATWPQNFRSKRPGDPGTPQAYTDGPEAEPQMDSVKSWGVPAFSRGFSRLITKQSLSLCRSSFTIDAAFQDSFQSRRSDDDGAGAGADRDLRRNRGL